LRIAVFASAFHPHVGGVEELCRQLALEYRRQDHAVVILTNRWPRSLPDHEVIDGIVVRRLAFRAPDAGLKSQITYHLTQGWVVDEVCRILTAAGTEVIHVQCVGANGYYASIAAEQLSLPLVVTLQGELSMDATGLFERSAFARSTLRKCLRDADAVTACSRQTLGEAERWFGGELFGDRGSVIYNGIAIEDAKTAPFSHHRPYVLAIGRHVPQKGFDLLLRAFARLVADPGINQDLILAGDGTEHASLVALAHELSLGDRVRFTGRVDHATAMKLFAGCLFFVLPSRHEPFGIVNLEAMAAGKAVVATRVGGVPEIVHDNVNGLLVPPEDETRLAQAISTLAGSETLRESMGTAAAQHARRFEWSKIAAEYLHCYEQVLGRAPVSKAPDRPVDVETSRC